MSRDLDSRISAREVAAVEEWRKESNYTIHSMRDHPLHNVGLGGGSWGSDLTRNVTESNGKTISARQAWQIAWKEMLKDKKTYARRRELGPDQTVITR